MQTKRILLVEDSPDDAELTRTGLADSHLPHEIVVTRDGAEALDYLYARGSFAGRLSGDPAVIFLDLKLQTVDGREVLRQVKGDPLLHHIPIVVLTGSDAEHDQLESYHLGANSYVVKPHDGDQFVALVIHLIRFWTLLNELSSPTPHQP